MPGARLLSGDSGRVPGVVADKAIANVLAFY
jgi:hypothetical protein